MDIDVFLFVFFAFAPSVLYEGKAYVVAGKKTAGHPLFFFLYIYFFPKHRASSYFDIDRQRALNCERCCFGGNMLNQTYSPSSPKKKQPAASGFMWSSKPRSTLDVCIHAWFIVQVFSNRK